MKKVNKLGRAEMKKVLGGVAESKCTADCGDGTSVTCSGAGCTAKDGSGCTQVDSNGNSSSKSCGGTIS